MIPLVEFFPPCNLIGSFLSFFILRALSLLVVFIEVFTEVYSDWRIFLTLFLIGRLISISSVLD